VNVRPLDDADHAWLTEIMTRQWGLPVVSISGAYDPRTLRGLVAVEAGQRLGVITYRRTERECEVVTLNSVQPNRGMGTALLGAVKRIADDCCLRLWLITTDTNTRAIRFYENRGMRRRARHRDFIETVRLYKPDSPDRGVGGHSRDAIEFSY
jgi:ribosomal protein S18 acetylase RimI-like enzyme